MNCINICLASQNLIQKVSKSPIIWKCGPLLQCQNLIQKVSKNQDNQRNKKQGRVRILFRKFQSPLAPALCLRGAPLESYLESFKDSVRINSPDPIQSQNLIQKVSKPNKLLLYITSTLVRILFRKFQRHLQQSCLQIWQELESYLESFKGLFFDCS